MVSDYQTSRSEAGRRGRDKLQGLIDKARYSAEAVVEEIQSRVIVDKVVRTPAVRLVEDARAAGGLDLSVGGELVSLHKHAFGQVLADAGVPKKFADYVMEDDANDEGWGAELVAHNVNTILSHRDKQRNLVRIEGGTLAKGFLSDKFRRLDSRPLLDAFMGASTELGLIPYQGVASDTKMRLRAILPEVFEPLDGEVMVFGAEFGNSDYGDGGVNLNLWMMRIICTNLAIGERMLRQIHLGGRLPDDVRLSEETYKKDAETTALAIRDVTGSVIGSSRINRMVEAIREAGDERIGDERITKILKGFDKAEGIRIRDIFDSPDVENLPVGRTLWRMSNAVSFFAQTPDLSADRRLDLQHAAGVMVAGDYKPSREV